MLKSLTFLGAVALSCLLSSGCAGPERKLGRGMNNISEIVRWGEMRRSVEQAGIFQGPASARGTGLIRGFNRSIARVGIGIYEVATFPIPSYKPIFTNHLTPDPAYPDSYKPGLPDIAVFDTDVALGFSGGEIAPLMPGSRFAIFKTP